MKSLTYFDLDPCGGFSHMFVTDAEPDILNSIEAYTNKDGKLNIEQQENAITEILKSRGYSIESIEQKIHILININNQNTQC